MTEHTPDTGAGTGPEATTSGPAPEAGAASPRCGGRDGSRHTAYRAARKVTTSIE